MSAQHVWYDDHGAGRNRFAIFRRVITVEGEVGEAVLHCFADARYRLRVNGRIVAHGPGRFVPAWPMYDSIDLKTWLQPGSNVITLEVNAPGASSFQAMPECRGSLLAWGTIGSQDLQTPGDWQVRRAGAWDELSPPFSFAQGPTEICDCGQLPEAWFTDPKAGGFEPVTLIADQSTWGTPEPRSLGPLRGEIDGFRRISLLASCCDDEERFACRTYTQDHRQKKGTWSSEPRFSVAACIYSPRDQQAVLGLFWGPWWCNGEPCQMLADPLLGNRENTTVSLREGWNLLYGEVATLSECWGVEIALPRSAGLFMAADADRSCAHALRYSEVLPYDELKAQRGALPTSVEELATCGLEWKRVDRQAASLLPARDCAWDRPAGILAADEPLTFPRPLAPGRDHVLLLDAGYEFLGHGHLELDCPEGTIVDLVVDERLREDGLLAIFKASCFTDAADRFRCVAGRQCIDAFHPRGGRYLQVHIRPPKDSEQPVILYDAGIRSAQVEVHRDGRFSCADPVFNWAWDACHQTIQACVEDAFLDCPWRERGTYLGDALVEAGTLRSFDRDQRVTERCIDLWAQGQMPDGQMQACVPSWHRRPHEDFTLIWILLLHDYWKHSGKTERVERWWSVVGNIFASPAWKSSQSVLWDALDLHIFIDWGCPGDGKKGAEHAALNAFRYRALCCAAELAEEIGKDDEAKRYAAQAIEVKAAFQQRLWAGRRFATCREGEGFGHRADLHPNILALAFGLCAEDQLAGCLRFVSERLADNCRQGVEQDQGSGHAELYFLSYAYEALYNHDQAELAEAVIRDHYGLMQAHGAWTIWECFARGVRGVGSLCHAWSCAQSIAMRERVLGVRPAVDGDPTKILIAPDSALAWAKGVVPLEAGDVSVQWKREGDRLEISVQVPAGVSYELRPGKAFAGCTVIEQFPGKTP